MEKIASVLAGALTRRKRIVALVGFGAVRSGACPEISLNQHATFNYRKDLFDDKLLIHVNISEIEFDKAYKPDYALVSDARLAVAALLDALEKKVGEVPAVQVNG